MALVAAVAAAAGGLELRLPLAALHSSGLVPESSDRLPCSSMALVQVEFLIKKHI